MLTQSLRTDPERRLLVIQLCEEKDCAAKAAEVGTLLDIGADRKNQVTVQPSSVKDFLQHPQLSEHLIKLIPPSKDVPF